MRQVASGLRFPEGPVAMPDGSVILVELEQKAVTRIGPEGKRTVVAVPGGSPNGAAIGPDGRCYVCNSGGANWHEDEHGLRPVLQADDYSGGRIEAIDLATGKVEVLYSEAAGRKLRGPNDLVFDAHGGFWFTDHGKSRQYDQDRGVVYYAKPDGSSIKQVIHPMITPNGVGLSPDGRRLYVSETLTSRLWAFDIVEPGEIARRPWPSPHGGEIVIGLPGFQYFDSMAVDSAGNICVATLIRGGVAVISPKGELVEHIAIDDQFTTNICFGGPQLKTAYVTLGATGKLVALDWPRSGAPLHFLNK